MFCDIIVEVNLLTMEPPVKIICYRNEVKQVDLTESYTVSRLAFEKAVPSLLGIDFRWQYGENSCVVYISKRDSRGFEFMLKTMGISALKINKAPAAAF